MVAGIVGTKQFAYDIWGDSVNIAGVDGKVQAITMRETVLRNIDGEVLHIPNGLVNVATNKTMEFAAINMELGVSYDTDLDKVKGVIPFKDTIFARDE